MNRNDNNQRHTLWEYRPHRPHGTYRTYLQDHPYAPIVVVAAFWVVHPANTYPLC
jgi:hypothetical protein